MRKFIQNMLWKFGIYSEEEIFLRNLDEREKKVSDYSKSNEIWQKKKVHNTLRNDYFEKEARHVSNKLKIEKNDVVLSIGCGDGRLDFYLLEYCKSIVGFDFSENKIVEAQTRNPKAYYWRQSFLQDIVPGVAALDKGYSMCVMQYCMPKDLSEFFSIQYRLCEAYKIKELIHFSVPDKRKAYVWYKNFNRDIVDKYVDRLNVIFPEDGSYWHDMDIVKECAEKEGFVVEITPSNCDYRSDISLRIKE